MVEDRLRDGRRVAQLFASEVTGDPALAARVVDADREVDPTPAGAFAYAVVRATGTDDPADQPGTADRVAEVYVHPERARVEFLVGQAAAAAAAEEADLRVRPRSTDPPRTLLFLDDGAAAKRAGAVLRAALGADEGPGANADGE